ncbi:39S ribosomal protein L47, mitochondrial [Patella vulgata]|uniref:39S ribosomal protein L47, mitochondrial n=1 Tax=Patella vulgata TaxID=6465 RepID=UPI0021806CA9|nr:39S ribosomal protein L47, mitochondrial [Patella vulgata]
MAFLKSSFQFVRCFSRIPQLSLLTNQLTLNKRIHGDSPLPTTASFSTTTTRFGLDEFFDDEENWPKGTVKVGRPWRVDELRIKSNSDLHKLWYVLLKERNMLLTMEEHYTQESELFPSPERIFKVEESMENILDVVKERDIAFNLLETGKTGQPEKVTIRNFLGLKYERTVEEHSVPKSMNRLFNLLHPKYDKYFVRFFNLNEEKKRKEQSKENQLINQYRKRMIEKFPHLKNHEEFRKREKVNMY